MIDRGAFYRDIRESLFHVLSQGQVDGTNAILDEWEQDRAADDTRWLAYVLATAYHETAHTMAPIEEYGKGKGHAYGLPDPDTQAAYYGRGFCQLTWKANYSKASDVCGLDLVRHPELALEPHIAAEIICQGMKDGWFTGKKLSDYFSEVKDDPVGARHIINGSDRADLVASYYRKFANALTEAKRPEAVDPYADPQSDAPPSHKWWQLWK